MSVVWQPDLFASAGAAAVDARFENGKRTELDARSWIELFPGWLSGADALFARLAEAAHWEQRNRRIFEKVFVEPRLTAEYRSGADFPDATLLEAADALSKHYGVRYDGLWINLYRHGRDSTAWHNDRISCRRELCTVPVLTLGATRRFLIKPKKGGSSVAFQPAAGDLLVMRGRCQRDWVHGVPKVASAAGARISVNFMSSEQGNI